MSKEGLLPGPERFRLDRVAASLQDVEVNWSSIDAELQRQGVGSRDVPFNQQVRERMMIGYTHVDKLLAQRVEPFSPKSISDILVLNNLVHYGYDRDLMSEYNSSICANTEKFYQQIEPIHDWYHRHKRRGDNPQKIAAEIYVSILGHPQLFIEGNHRTGALVASWINMHHGYPPFVLSVDNAVSYFAPSDDIKHFADKSSWRGKTKLPKYRKSFTEYWKANTDRKYMQP